jgi:hypothetical protein
MDDTTALFHQYETDYCNKSTDISRKISSIAALTGGMQHFFDHIDTIVAWAKWLLKSLALECAWHCACLLQHAKMYVPARAELRRKKIGEIEADVREADNVVGATSSNSSMRVITCPTTAADVYSQLPAQRSKPAS